MVDLSLFDLSGKKALVTGGAGGIGRACALGLARAGADVAIIDLKVDLGKETVKEIKALGRNSIFIECDISKFDQVANMVREVVRVFDRIDIAMNNAGIIVGTTAPTISDESLEYWQKTIDVDLNGVFYCCREEAKQMVLQRSGKIINTASISASIANNYPSFGGGWVAYCTAKAGVKHLSRALAMELVQFNIRVNSISPGYVITPMSAGVQDNPILLNHENLMTPMNRQATAEEMVGGVLYLASDASSYTTGHDLVMDGGYMSW